ncbi:hypothetical protein RHMOL_Rhmol05G0124000 [Rhododendron molle]|uniref:Uncharacterized protein n=1 Tax=Rhododendron molle TaxID=49168 RepID=A0ACC0NQF5_RHOML|nr:hypothetical protein RHMOL_Rhmol05G0124000 [Rhododendron molle]
MSLPEIQKFPIQYHKIKVWLEPGKEAIHQAEAIWWLGKVSMKIKLRNPLADAAEQHRVVVKPIRIQALNLTKVYELLNPAGFVPLDSHINFMNSFKILIWNCRGAGNDKFRRNFSEFFRQHHPEVVGLVETKFKMDSMGLFFNNFGLTNSHFVDPNGRSGGIWVLWDPTKVSVSINYSNFQAVHVTIQKNGFASWFLSVVYASPNPRLRETLWEDLKFFAASNSNTPWVAAGDFNEVAAADESRSNTPDSSASVRRRFVDNINSCDLMDMGFTGPKLTWTNGRQGLACVQKRLDRGLCNEEWREVFPEGNIKLNVDGCWYNADRNAGLGGIIRDTNGTWVLGFYGKMIAESSTEAEIWSIYRGLTIILEKGLANVDIESDSLIAVNIINAGTPGNHPQSIIINDAKMLLQQTKSKLTHIYRTANQCADHLARMGAEQNDNLVVLDQAPISIREFLIRDCLNTRQICD